jgi:hypothetical protein
MPVFVWSEEKRLEKFNAMRVHPVKRRLVDLPDKCAYSQFYELGDTSVLKVDRPG